MTGKNAKFRRYVKHCWGLQTQVGGASVGLVQTGKMPGELLHDSNPF